MHNKMNIGARSGGCGPSYISSVEQRVYNGSSKSEFHSADRRSNENIHYNRGKFRAWV